MAVAKRARIEPTFHAETWPRVTRMFNVSFDNEAISLAKTNMQKSRTDVGIAEEVIERFRESMRSNNILSQQMYIVPGCEKISFVATNTGFNFSSSVSKTLNGMCSSAMDQTTSVCFIFFELESVSVLTPIWVTPGITPKTCTIWLCDAYGETFRHCLHLCIAAILQESRTPLNPHEFRLLSRPPAGISISNLTDHPWLTAEHELHLMPENVVHAGWVLLVNTFLLVEMTHRKNNLQQVEAVVMKQLEERKKQTPDELHTLLMTLFVATFGGRMRTSMKSWNMSQMKHVKL